ncbi:MAG: YigZ family protein [Lachnospiraceae bacterium]|nr:YigZ family protein [Lachnospiraceae bacterium]
MEPFIKITKPGDAVIEVKRSKFIGAVRPVSDEQEALLFLDSEKKKYHDAKHHCSAYIIRASRDTAPDIVHSSDDGEPSGTAGKPILEVIDKAGIKDVICVVTRYFGGILLGTGGLVRAYTDAAKAALENSGRAEMHLVQEILLEFDYTHTGRVDNIINGASCKRKDAVYTDIVRYVITCDPLKTEGLIRSLLEATAGSLKAEKTKQIFEER